MPKGNYPYDSGSIWSKEHDYNPLLLVCAELEMGVSSLSKGLDELGKMVENPPTETLDEMRRRDSDPTHIRYYV
jgi:hypothetical protein